MPGSATLLASNFGATSATTITVACTLTAGRKYAIGVIGADVGAAVTGADTLGNTYVHRGAVVEAAIARRHHGLTMDPTTTGATTITITYPAAADNRQVYVLEVSDVGAYDAFGTATDTGNNPTTAATATNTVQPAFCLAAILDYQGGTPTVGTIGGAAGVDEGTLFVGSGMLIGRVESNSVATVASQSANFGNPTGNRTTTVFWIFSEVAPPVITAQPTDQTVNNAATATFTVSATGTGTLHYQWKDDGTNVGTDSSTYAPTATYAMQGAQITVDVTDDNGTTVSDAATLTVAWNLTAGTGARKNRRFAAAPFASDGFLGAPASGGGTAAVADAVAFSDSASGRLGAKASASDTIAFTDSAVGGLRMQALVSDTVAFSDSVTGRLRAEALAADTITFSDSVTGRLGAKASASDTIAFTDSATGLLRAAARADDTVAFTDSSTASLAGATTAAAADTIAFTDSATGRLGAVARAADTITFSDSVTGRLGAKASASDTIAFTDSAVGGLRVRALVTDTVAFTDSVTGRLGARALAADTIAFTDSATGRLGAKALASDTLAFTDSATATGSGARSAAASDSVFFSDSARAVGPPARKVGSGGGANRRRRAAAQQARATEEAMILDLTFALLASGVLDG